MKKSRRSSLAMLALTALSVAADAPSGDVSPETATQLLNEAFANQYEIDSTARIELVIRNRSGQERRRHIDAATRIVGDRLQSIGRLVYPERLRGMTILQIETANRSHDAYVYLPSMRSVRRVSAAQRGDAFFGTDVTYEDLERRDIRDYQVVAAWTETNDGEAVVVVEARPRRPRSYSLLRFWIALADRAFLKLHFYKRDSSAEVSEPFRTIAALRSDMLKTNGHTLPTRLVVANHARGTTTEIRYLDLQVNPEIDGRVFSIQTLERGGRIPGAR